MRVLETVKCGASTAFTSKTPMLNQILKQTNCSVLVCNGDLKVKDSMLSSLHMPILFSVPSRKTALGLPGDIATSFPESFTLPWERGFLLFFEYAINRIRQRPLHCHQLVGWYNRVISISRNFSRVYSFSFYHSHIIFSNEETRSCRGLATIIAAILSLRTSLMSCENALSNSKCFPSFFVLFVIRDNDGWVTPF